MRHSIRKLFILICVCGFLPLQAQVIEGLSEEAPLKKAVRVGLSLTPQFSIHRSSFNLVPQDGEALVILKETSNLSSLLLGARLQVQVGDADDGKLRFFASFAYRPAQMVIKDGTAEDGSDSDYGPIVVDDHKGLYENGQAVSQINFLSIAPGVRYFLPEIAPKLRALADFSLSVNGKIFQTYPKWTENRRSGQKENTKYFVGRSQEYFGIRGENGLDLDEPTYIDFSARLGIGLLYDVSPKYSLFLNIGYERGFLNLYNVSPDRLRSMANQPASEEPALSVDHTQQLDAISIDIGFLF